MGSVIQYYYTSHTGCIRKNNQDNFLVPEGYLPWDNQGTDGVRQGAVSVENSPLFAVFDGMGGEERGEMAAAIAAETFSQADLSGDPVQRLQETCLLANENICRFAGENGVITMGTTAALLRFSPRDASLCNIGDSKVFVYSGGKFVQLSCDHLGVAAYGRKPPLSQNLGIPPEELIIDPFIAQGNYFPGDVFLLCTDGLTDMVPAERIEMILAEPPEVASRHLLQEALQNGGKDNVTFVLLSITDNK